MVRAAVCAEEFRPDGRAERSQLDRRSLAVGNDDGASRRRTVLWFDPDPERLAVQEPPRANQDRPSLAARDGSEIHPLPKARAES